MAQQVREHALLDTRSTRCILHDLKYAIGLSGSYSPTGPRRNETKMQSDDPLGWKSINQALQPSQKLRRQRDVSEAVNLSQNAHMGLATGANNVPGAKLGQLLSTKSAATEEANDELVSFGRGRGFQLIYLVPRENIS